jgi:rhodanese-related sulfurtransferase
LAKIGTENTVLLDVRRAEEIAEGYVPGAIALNFQDENFAKIITILDKSKNYLIYCRSGNRSGKACALMAENGFGQLHNLAGGMLEWTGPITK